MLDLIHFALGLYTACNEHIVGSIISWSEVNSDPQTLTGHGKNVQHTCLVEYVTCDKCKRSATYLDYLKTLEDD